MNKRKNKKKKNMRWGGASARAMEENRKRKKIDDITDVDIGDTSFSVTLKGVSTLIVLKQE